MLYSLAVHLLIFSLAFLFVHKKIKEPPAPFTARIVTPEELKEIPAPQAKLPPKQPKIPAAREKDSRMPRLPKDLPPPKKLFAVPSQRTPGKKSGDTYSPSHVPGREPRSALPPVKSPSTAAPDTARQKDELTSSELGQQGALKHGPTTLPSPRTLREKLFDKNIIGQLARKGNEEAKHDNGITFDTTEYKYYGYMQRLRERIESVWRYPSDAEEKGIYGDLYIRFTIKKNGRLGAVELARTSGHKDLDDAAMKALRDADPFWPLPDEWGEDAFTITGHFIYALHGMFIR